MTWRTKAYQKRSVKPISKACPLLHPLLPCLLAAIARRLSTETVKGSALSLEGVDDVERGDGLSLGVLGVGDRVSDDVLKASDGVSFDNIVDI